MNKTIVLEEYSKTRAKKIGVLKKYGIVILFVFPFLASFITFFILPLFYGIYISLTDFKYGNPGVETFNSFEWFKMLFDKTHTPGIYTSFWLAFNHTLLFAIIMVFTVIQNWVSSKKVHY